MDELNKTEQLNIRISQVQKERLTEAAHIVGRERGESIDLATLARELITSGADDIRSRAPQAA